MTFLPCPKCGAPITQAHHLNQGMGGFTYVIRCSCGLMFDTGALSEEAAAEKWDERPAVSATITLSGCDFTEQQLLARVMRNISGVNRYGTQRWVRVRDTFGCGSGVANALCRRFGHDPDEMLKK